METTAELEKTVAELNDLVRGSVEGSQKAVAELKTIVEAQDARLAAVDQLRKDIDGLSTDFRKQVKIISTRVGPDPYYRGVFESREQACKFGLTVMARCCGNPKAAERLVKMDPELKAMIEGTDVAGGFLVNEEFHAAIIRRVEQYGVFRRNAMFVPMGSDRDIWPKRTGGLTVYCPGEGVAPTESTPTLGVVALTAKQWLTLTAISSQLNEDAAVAIAEFLADEIALAFAMKEDSCGLVGDGTSTYFGVTGVLNHGDTANQACGSGDSTFAEGCKWTYLAGVLGEVPSWALFDGRYYFHRSVFFKNVVGQVDSNGVPIVKFVTAGGEARGAPLQLGGATPLLLGFPVELTEVFPAIADDAVSTAFWAFGSLRRGWYLGMRGPMEVARSTEVYFKEGLTAIRGAERVDMVPSAANAMVKTTTAAS